MTKKLPALFALLFITSQAFSQEPLPNPGFENWTAGNGFDDPDGWNTLNPSSSLLNVITVSKATDPADVHSGDAAIKMETGYIDFPFNTLTPALVTTGTINTVTQNIEGGIAYNQRPDSIAGWYKFIPVGDDTAAVEILLFRNEEEIGSGRWTETNTVTTWTRFSAPIIYTNDSIPDLSRFVLLSSSGLAGSVSTVLFLDDLELIGHSEVGVGDDFGNAFNIFPNPADNSLFIQFENSNMKMVELLGIRGKVLHRSEVPGLNMQIDVSRFKPGIYFIRSIDKSAKKIVVRKIIKL